MTLALALPLGFAACSIPREVDPRIIYDEVTGEIDAGRERPPGLDQPFPNLGSVPPRPDRPDARMRAGLTSELEMDRSRSREPLAPRETPADPAEAIAPGVPPLPAAPPPPPSLASAVAVPWGPAVPNQAPGATLPGGPPPLPEPGEVPAAPAPDLLAAPPPLPRIE